MARRNNRQSIAASPSTTEIFQSATAEAGDGGDGAACDGIIVSCAPDSSNPMEYRLEGPGGDPSGEWARLEAGESVTLYGRRNVAGAESKIHHVSARGAGGTATGGVEIVEP